MATRTTARRVATTAAAAAIAAATATGAAEAKTVTLTDDTAAEFAQGTTGDATVVRTPGAVELARTLEEQFDGAARPAAWTYTAETPDTGSATVAGGKLLVDGMRVNTGVLAGPGQSVEFKADLGVGVPFRSIGFASDLGMGPWAIFNTGNNSNLLDPLYVRSSAGESDPLPEERTSIAHGGGTHTYKIAWTADGFDYSVDGTLVKQHVTVKLTAPMAIAANDFTAGDGGTLAIDSIAISTHKDEGTYTSRVLDAGASAVTALALSASSAGTGTIVYETRTSATPAGFADDWAPVTGGVIASPVRRYLQYRARLATPNAEQTPAVDKVSVTFTIDDVAPAVALGDVKVTGDQADVTFTQDEAGQATCALDGGAAAPCTSPARFTGLAAGQHTVTVKVTDAAGNAGTASKTFTVPTPPKGGGGTPPTGSGGTPPTGAPADVTAPNVLVLGRKLTVTGRVTSLRVRCPRAEDSCVVTVKLKRAGKTVARRKLTLTSGETRAFSLRLARSARKALAKQGRLAVAAAVTAVDAAGNRTTVTRGVTLKRG
jgi:hypothetical protein